MRQTADGDALAKHASARLRCLRLDVTDAQSIAQAVDTVGSFAPGGLHGLVNNAGIVVSGPLEYLPLDDLRRQLEVNTIAPIAVTQAFAPLLRKAGGRIVNMSSDCGRFSAPYFGPYCASKYALEALTDALRMELRSHGMRVSLIEPGSIQSSIWRKSVDDLDRVMESLPAEARARYADAAAKSRRATVAMGSTSRSAAAVARTVAQALTAKHPKPRYIVGYDAWLSIAAARFLPTRVMDYLIMRSLGLH